MRRLFGYLTPHRARLRLAVFASVMNKVLDLMPPLLVAWVIDSVQGRAPAFIAALSGSRDPMRLAVVLSILAVVIFAFESFFQWLYQHAFLTLAQLVQHELRL